jgi:hypothetical protein
MSRKSNAALEGRSILVLLGVPSHDLRHFHSLLLLSIAMRMRAIASWFSSILTAFTGKLSICVQAGTHERKWWSRGNLDDAHESRAGGRERVNLIEKISSSDLREREKKLISFNMKCKTYKVLFLALAFNTDIALLKTLKGKCLRSD